MTVQHVPDEWKGSTQIATLSLMAVVTTDVTSLPPQFCARLPALIFKPGPTRIFRALTG